VPAARLRARRALHGRAARAARAPPRQGRLPARDGLLRQPLQPQGLCTK